MWTYTGDYSAAEGKAVEPMLLHVYTSPATIESFGGRLKGVWSGDGKGARHSLSPSVRPVSSSRTEHRFILSREYCTVWYVVYGAQYITTGNTSKHH